MSTCRLKQDSICAWCRRADSRESRVSYANAKQIPTEAVDGECPHGVPWGWQPQGSENASVATVAKRVAHGVKSITKTAIGIDRVDDETYHARLAACEKCDHAKRNKDGSLYTCGPMIESLRAKKQATCGCVLRLKARDKNEACPQGKWSGRPKDKRQEVDGTN